MKDDAFAEWRANHRRYGERGEKTIAFAVEHGLHELPFELSTCGGILTWAKYGESLHQFTARVHSVTLLLGQPPDRAVQDTSLPTNENPDLSASWNIDDNISVSVRNRSGQCKLDPRSGYAPIDWGKARKIHPECKAVLDSLMNLDAITVAAGEEATNAHEESNP